MNIETDKPINRTINAYVGGISNRFSKRQIWTHCPRCVGGNMHRELNGKFVCIQCGCSYYPDKVTQKLIVRGTL
jgi:uncharacterized protein (DUF983 family)